MKSRSTNTQIHDRNTVKVNFKFKTSISENQVTIEKDGVFKDKVDNTVRHWVDVSSKCVFFLLEKTFLIAFVGGSLGGRVKTAMMLIKV